jgi:hypothetical protein
VLSAFADWGPEVLQHAATELFADSDFVLKMVINVVDRDQHDSLFHCANVSPVLLADREFVLAAGNRDFFAFDYAAEELWADEEFVLAAMQKHGFWNAFGPYLSEGKFFHISEELRSNRGFMLKAMKTGWPDGLHFASEELRADEEFVLAGIEYGGGHMLEAASVDLRRNKRVVFAAVARYQIGNPLQFVSKELLADREIVLAGITKNSVALKYAASELQVDEHFLLSSVCCNDEALCHLPNELLANKAFVVAAMRRNGDALQHLPSTRQLTRNAIGFFRMVTIPHALLADKDVVFAAVAQSSRALLHATAPLRDDPVLVRISSVASVPLLRLQLALALQSGITDAAPSVASSSATMHAGGQCAIAGLSGDIIELVGTHITRGLMVCCLASRHGYDRRSSKRRLSSTTAWPVCDQRE